MQSVSQAEVAAGECLSTKMRVICEPVATKEQLVGRGVNDESRVEWDVRAKQTDQ